MGLFKKIACFTDIHLGHKNNSHVHLRDCEDFVDWFISEAKKNGCETGAFLGDWHHHRNSINFVTLDLSTRCLEKLGAAFEQFFWFPGNHDLFYRDKREVHSSSFAHHIPGVTVVDKVTTIDDVTFIPWLIGDEWKTISKINSKYIFGHLELPKFYMNAMIQMPDHGQLQTSHFVHQEYVFSGHFHKRQNQGKVWYIGNAFPHNFSDAGDDERGMMILDWGGKPNFIKWADAPKFRVVNLSDLIDNSDTICKSKMYLRVNLDIDVTYEESNFLKETFMSQYDIREMSMIPQKDNVEAGDDSTPVEFSTVDEIVTQELVNINSEQYDYKVLLKIYQDL